MPVTSAAPTLAIPTIMPCTRSPMRYAHSDGHTDLCYTEDGKTLITCGSDGDVRLWADLEDDDPMSQCVGEHAFALAVQGGRLLVGTDSHSVQAYTLPALERDGVVTRFTAHVTHISVVNGLVAAGSKDMEIHVVNSESGDVKVILGHTGPVLGVALDPLGVYLASSGGDGTVRVWLVSSGAEQVRWAALPACAALVSATALGRCGWQPGGALLAVPRAAGSVALVQRQTWAELRVLTDPGCAEHVSIAAFSACGRLVAGSGTTGHVSVWRVEDGDVVGSSAHARGTLVTALAWSGPRQLALCDALGQLGTLDLDPAVLGGTKEAAVIAGVVAPGSHRPLDAALEDDLDDLFEAAPRPASPGFDDIDIASVNGSERSVSRGGSRGGSRAAGVRDETQPPFQPGSSPDHLQHRYLVWNGTGVVRAQRSEGEGAVEVELHDAAVHHALRLPNVAGHTLAALSDAALALAGPSIDDQPGLLEVRLWSGGEWRLRLPAGEEALALAAGAGFVALATDCRKLRLFALRGGQRQVLALPGPVVALAALRHRLAVVCNMAAGTGSGPALGMSVLRVSERETRGGPWSPLPLSPDAVLQWVGFTDEGAAAAVDSLGMLRLRSADDAWWRPVADLRQHTKGVSDHVFVLGVSERLAVVRGVVCRGARFPPTTPRPPVQELPLQVPLCEASGEQTALEGGFLLRAALKPSLAAAADCQAELAENNAKQDEALLKLFALAARGGMDGRALALVPLMPANVRLLAAKYAGKLGKFELADRVEDTPPPQGELDAAACVSEGEADETSLPPSPPPPSLLLNGPPRSPPLVIRPCLLLSAKKCRNPFKREAGVRTAGNGLALLEEKAVRRAKDSAGSVSAAVPAKAAVVKTLRQTALKPAAAAGAGAAVAVPFPKWFASRRAALQAEHPDLSSAQLCKLATERYKLENRPAAGENPLGFTGSKLVARADAQTESQPEAQPETEMMDTQEEDIVENSQVVVEQAGRKRKLDLTESADAAKPASKLSAFAFKKT